MTYEIIITSDTYVKLKEIAGQRSPEQTIKNIVNCLWNKKNEYIDVKNLEKEIDALCTRRVA